MMTDGENGIRARLDNVERETLRTRERLHAIENTLQSLAGGSEVIKANCTGCQDKYTTRMERMEMDIAKLATKEQMQAVIDRFDPLQRALHWTVGLVMGAVLLALLYVVLSPPLIP